MNRVDQQSKMCITFSSDMIITYFFATHLNPILMCSVFVSFQGAKPLLNLILYSDHHAVGHAPTQAIPHHTDDLYLAGARNHIGEFVDKL